MRSLICFITMCFLSISSTTVFAENIFGPKKSKKNPTMEKFFGGKFYISFENKDKKVAKDVCSAMTVVLNNTYSMPEGRCVYEDKGLTNQELKKKHAFAIKFIDDKETDTYKVVANYLNGDDLDIKDITWNLKNSKHPKFNTAVKEIIFKLIDYEKNSEKYKEILFFKAIAQSKTIRPIDENRFEYIDSNTTVNKEVAMLQFARESKRNKNYLKAGLELGALLGIGQALYFAGHDMMAEDQEYTNKSFSDFKNRMFTMDQAGFDDNDVSMNWGHSYAGMLYYQSARNNGFSSKESFLVAIASSTIWEVFGEHREIMSINDQINTGIGGSIIGEVGYQISNMLKGKTGVTAKIINAMVNPMGAINNWVSGKSLDSGHRNFSREYGFDGDNYEDFHILTGLTYLDNKKTAQTKKLVEIGFEAEVINLPIEGEGRISSVVYDPLMAKLSMNTHLSQDGVEDFHAITKLALAGYFNKNIIRDESGELKGHSFYIGAASKTEYRSRGVDHADDFFAVVNVLGGTLDVHYFIKGTKIRFAVDIYGDFAMVRPYGIDKYKENGGSLEGGNTVLKRKNYYYATGITKGLSFSVERGKWKTGLDAVNHHFQSINSKSLDRYSENITRKLDMKDKYQSIKFYVSYQASKSSRVVLGLERLIREGTVHDQTDGIKFGQDSTEDRIYLNYEHDL